MPDNLLVLAAVVLAVLAAILAFFFNVDLDTLVGLVSVSLACWYASAYPTR
jgi:hypothetical protein